MTIRARERDRVMTEGDTMLAQLTKTPGDLAVLAMLADWHADRGEPSLSRACRWCVAHRKYPARGKRTGSWIYCHDDHNMHARVLDFEEHARLPYAVFRAVKLTRSAVVRYPTIWFSSYRRALAELAKGLDSVRRLLLPTDAE
jgi:hypothetical protein